MKKDILKKAALTLGTPCYVFDTDVFAKRTTAVKNAFGDRVGLCYSIKANPFLLAELPEEFSYIEVCSPGELSICEEVGAPLDKIIFSGVNKTEEDIASFDSYEDKKMFLDELGLEESGVNRLIKKAYSLLNLETFITAGEMEVKAWTYHKGWKAPQCAGVIHTDFEKGFIRAEVIKYDDYIQYGSEAAVREAGKMGIEGKDYVVQDGDIMHFRFNV